MTEPRLKYGPNTSLVIGFLSLLSATDAADRTTIYLRDPSRLLICSARRSMWEAAYNGVMEGLRLTKRMTAAGEAWVSAHEILRASQIKTTARFTLDGLVGWDLITHEQRVALWEPFAALAPLPGTERRAG